MSTLSKALRWGLHLLGENAEARIRELTRKVEGLQAAYDLLSATAKAERDEYDRFIARLTPRTYRSGDPQPQGTAFCWGKDHWSVDLSGWLDPGDIYLDLPPPSEWPQPWTGTAAQQQIAHDALEKVTQERDEARQKLAAALDGRDPETGRHDAYLCERRKRKEVEAELARLRPHYDAIMALAGACDGDPDDPASVATTFLDMGKAMLKVQQERDECAARVHEHARRLDRVREILRKWEWTEDQITSFVALPGEPRTHVFPALADVALDMQRARDEAIEQRDAARAELARVLGQAKADMASAELARLRAVFARLTPRTYHHGEPRPDGMVYWWDSGFDLWQEIAGETLAQGDVYIDLPSPAKWPKSCMAPMSSAPSNPIDWEQVQSAWRSLYHAVSDETSVACNSELWDEIWTIQHWEKRTGQPIGEDEKNALIKDRAHKILSLGRIYPSLHEPLRALFKALQMQIEQPGDSLDPGDRWLPQPPPPGEPWTGTLPQVYDALQKVAQERDALREAHREAQETLRDQETATAKAQQERDEANMRLFVERDETRAELAKVARERDKANTELDRLREVLLATQDQLRRRIADLAAALGTKPEGRPDDWHRLIGKVHDLREQTTPRRLSAPLVVRQPVLAWQRDAWFPAFHPVGLAPGNWILPQPPPPPDESGPQPSGGHGGVDVVAQ